MRGHWCTNCNTENAENECNLEQKQKQDKEISLNVYWSHQADLLC